MGIVAGEETASGSFFAELSAFTEQFKRKHGDVNIDEVQEVDQGSGDDQ